MELFKFITLKHDLFIEARTRYKKCRNASEAFRIFKEECKQVTLGQIEKYKLGFDAVNCQRIEG